MSSLIDLKSMTKIYKTGDSELVALNAVNFSVKRAELVSIMGASGSGKSTMMNILGFLDTCTEGKYFFNGEDVSNLSDDKLAEIRNKKIGFIFQSFFLLPRMTALQNVMLPLLYRGELKGDAEELAIGELEKVGMAAYCKHTPNQLSGGQQQRVAIARALVGDADLILADEPTGALDSKTGQEVIDLFIQLNQQEKRTILIITHDSKVAKQCQRVVQIRDGVIEKEMSGGQVET